MAMMGNDAYLMPRLQSVLYVCMYVVDQIERKKSDAHHQFALQ